MKKLLFCASLVVGVLLLATPANAATTTIKIPIDTTTSDCNGNTIELTGTLLGVFTTTATPSGGSTTSFHFNPQGVTGVDAVTGTTYRGTGVTQERTVSTPSGGSSFTSVNVFNIVPTNGGQRHAVQETVHVTVTPTGEITANVDNIHTVC